MKTFKLQDSHIWRKTKFWKEECDLAIKRQYRTFQKLFEKYGGKLSSKTSVSSKNKTVSPTEFLELINDSGLLNDTGVANLSAKDIVSLWNLSMMTQVDEISYDRHVNMNFTEFIEAICRVADELALPNPLEEKDAGEKPENLMKRPLHQKIEAFLLFLAKNCISEVFYENQAKPYLQQMKKQGLLAN